MDELTREQEEAVAATVGAIQRIAMAIVELPKEERTAHYAMVRRKFEAVMMNRHRRCRRTCVAEQYDGRNTVACN